MMDDAKFEAGYKGRNADTSGVTLVAFYGDGKSDKPQELLQFIQDLTRKVSEEASSFPGLFRDYPTVQIHATISGMEGDLNLDGQIVTDSMKKRAAKTGGELQPLAIDDFLGFIKHRSWPITFQLGGHTPDDTNPYDRERRPWARTFEIRPDGLAVLMGWSLHGDKKPFAPRLLELRKAFEHFGVVHKYHVEPDAVDNDLFMVVGALDFERWHELSADQRRTIREALVGLQDTIRNTMVTQRVWFDLSADQLWIVKYRRTTLEAVHFAKRITDVSANEILGLYK